MRIFLALLFLLSTFSFAEEIRKGVVTGSKLRMRAKPGTKYEVLGQLLKGDEVKVVAEHNGWLKLVSPDSVTGWISNKYIDHGKITGDNINVRAGANVAYPVFGKVHKGDEVEVLEIKSKIWAKIKAPSSSHVWVSAAYVKLEPMIVARDDKENEKLNDVKAVVEVKDKNEMLKDLEAKLKAEQKAAEDAKKKLADMILKKEEDEKELARLEAERKAAIDTKLADEKKFLVISKLLEEEIKKRSTKIIVTIDNNNEIFLGNQEVTKEELLAAFSATGNETVAFIVADEKADKEKITDLSDSLREVNANVFVEDPKPLIESKFIKVPESMKKDTELLQSSFITIEVTKDNEVVLSKVPTPNNYVEAILISYRENFGNSSVFIKSAKETDSKLLDDLMKVVQKVNFKLINYPSLMSQLKDAEEVVQSEEILQNTEIIEEVSISGTQEQKELPPGRVKMTGYILEVREQDKHLVDFALAAQVNGEFYAIAYLKGRKKELQSFYLKEVEIVGVSKRLDGWTRPILYVEEFKPLSK